MNIVHVPGQNRGKLFLYTLSTCVWCKRTKAFLSQLGLEYSYVDVDVESGAEQDRIMQQASRWTEQRSFPIIVIDDSTCIVGFQPDQIKEALGL